MVSNLSDATITVHKYAELAQMTEKATFVVNMSEDVHNLPNGSRSINAVLVLKAWLTATNREVNTNTSRGMTDEAWRQISVNN